MKNHYFIALLVAVIPFTAVKAETTFQGRLISSIDDYELNISNILASRDMGDDLSPRLTILDISRIDEIKNDDIEKGLDQNLSDTIISYGVGTTIVFDNGIYLDGYYTTSLDGEQAPSDSLIGDFGTNTDDFLRNTRNVGDVSFSRNDYAITVGKPIGNFSISGGYKSGETEVKQSFDFSSTGNMKTNVGGLDSNFEMSGPFVGFSYGLPTNYGVISANIAVADLTGDWKVRLINRNSNDTDNVPEGAFSGDAIGVSSNISWNQSITDRWSYSLGLSYYQYDFDVSGAGTQNVENTATGRTRSGELSASIEERLLSLKLNLKYSF